jgi:hypothetical protein
MTAGWLGLQNLSVGIFGSTEWALRLPMVLSVGAAGGWRDGHYRKTEWLASLKIM